MDYGGGRGGGLDTFRPAVPGKTSLQERSEECSFRFCPRNPTLTPSSKFQTGQEVSRGVGSDWQLEAPMGREPPLLHLSRSVDAGRSRPHCRSSALEGVEAGAEGEGGGRWRRLPQKVRPAGTRVLTPKSCQEGAGQGGV